MLFNKNIQINDFFESSVKMGLNPFTLKFAGNIEKEFLADYYKSSIFIFRFSLILGIILYSSFAFLDIILIPEIKNQVFAIRFLIVIPILLGAFLVSFQKKFDKWWQAAAIITVLTAGLGIIAIIWISPYNGKVFYYVGIILVLIYNYLITKIRFIWASITGFGLIIFYLLSIMTYENIPKDFLINNIFFLISANILGMFGSYILEYFSRRNFYLNHQLLFKNVELDVLNKSLDDKVFVRTKDLKESEEHYRSIIENAADAIFISDYFTNIIEVNQNACELMGFSQSELLKMKTTDLDDVPSLDEHKILWKELDKGEPLTIERTHRHKQGHSIPVEICLGMSEIVGERVILGFVRDITERKKVEADLSTYQNNLEEMVKERISEIEEKNKELSEKNKELEKYHELFVGREFRMKEIKDEIEILKLKMKK